MSVSNYTPSSAICKYNYSKLKDVIYLVDKTHVKNVHIDNGEAYIDGLDQLPLRLNGFNITLNEESSLDERYKFTKSVTLSMNGYVNSNMLHTPSICQKMCTRRTLHSHHRAISQH